MVDLLEEIIVSKYDFSVPKPVFGCCVVTTDYGCDSQCDWQCTIYDNKSVGGDN